MIPADPLPSVEDSFGLVSPQRKNAMVSLDAALEQQYKTLNLDRDSWQREVLLVSRMSSASGDMPSALAGLKLLGESIGVVETPQGPHTQHNHLHLPADASEQKRVLSESTQEELQAMVQRGRSASVSSVEPFGEDLL